MYNMGTYNSALALILPSHANPFSFVFMLLINLQYLAKLCHLLYMF